MQVCYLEVFSVCLERSKILALIVNSAIDIDTQSFMDKDKVLARSISILKQECEHHLSSITISKSVVRQGNSLYHQ